MRKKGRRSGKEARQVTVVDVARTARVALGTVSRVLNGHSNVNAAVRDRVLAAMRSLGYVRMRARKRSATRSRDARAETVAVICFGMEDTLVHVPVVSSALQGIERALSELGANLMFANIPRGDRIPAFLEDRSVAGVILKGPNQGLLPSEDASPLLRRIALLPRVWLMGRLPNATGDHCNFDTVHAGWLAARHLVDLGHRSVGFVDPKPGQVQFDKVRQSFCAAAAALGAHVRIFESERTAEPAWPLPAITDEIKVDLLVEEWLSLPDRGKPTALFAPSDRTAVQVYSALGRRGLQAGRDVSLLSCNNETSLIMGLAPGLTTIDIHAAAIGRCAVDALLARIGEAGVARPSTQVLVEPSLVVRGSVARI